MYSAPYMARVRAVLDEQNDDAVDVAIAVERAIRQFRAAIEAAYPAGVEMIDAGLQDMRDDMIGAIVSPLPGYVATNVYRALESVR
jgi:hypothetical protein